MALVDQINSLATRSGQEIKAVRNELATGLSGKAPTSHTHIIGDVTGLQAALDATAIGDTATNFVTTFESALVG